MAEYTFQNQNWKKTFIGEMEIRDSKISVFLDGETKIIHLFDLDEYGTRSLTNSISESYLDFISFELGTGIRHNAYMILLYGTDGVITKWKDGFKPIHSFEESYLTYKPFAEACKYRRNLFE